MISFAFTVLIVLKVIYDTDFQRVQHIRLMTLIKEQDEREAFMLHVDSLAVMDAVLKWTFALLLTFITATITN